MSGVISPLFTWRSAVASSSLPPSAKLVAFVLSLHMSELGESCFPSHETIAAKTSLARSTVAANLKILIDRSWLDRKSGGGRGKSNRYHATVPEETVRPSDGSVNRPTTDVNRPIDDAKPSDHRTLPRKDHVNTTGEAAASGKPNPIWDVLAEVFGDPPKRFHGHHAKVTWEIRDLLVADGVRDVEEAKAEVRRRRAALAGEWGPGKATKDALVKHWRLAGELADQGIAGGLSPEQIYGQALRAEEEKR